MPSPTLVGADGEVLKRQTSIWVDESIFEKAKQLARFWRLPPHRYFSLVVSRAIETCLAVEEEKAAAQSSTSSLPME